MDSKRKPIYPGAFLWAMGFLLTIALALSASPVLAGSVTPLLASFDLAARAASSAPGSGVEYRSGSSAPADTCVVPAEQSLAIPYSTSYRICHLGYFTTAPSGIHGIAFKNDDSNSLLIEGRGVLYKVPVIRDADNHITSFSPTVTQFAMAENGGSAFIYGPGGVLFYSRWPLNEIGEFEPGSAVPNAIVSLTPLGVKTWVTGVNFVPPGFPNAGALKLLSQVQGGMSNWYNATLEPDNAGTYNITSATLVTSTLPLSQQFIYVMPGSPLFTDYHAILVSEWSVSKVVAYTLDGEGNPLPNTRQIFINGLGAASSQAMDPVTGDILFSGGGASGFVSVRGFAPPAPPNNDKADLKIEQSLKSTKGISTTLNFMLTIKNQGPDPAAAVIVSDTVPASLKFLSASSSSGKPCAFDSASNRVTCPFDTLAAGQSALMSVSTAILTQDILSNCSEVKSDTTDPDQTNNSACIGYDPSGADLSLTVTGKFQAGKYATPGAAFTFELVNNGPGLALAPVVTSVLPGEVDYLGMGVATPGPKGEPVKCSFATDTRVVSCRFYNLRPGQKARITVFTRAHAGAQQAKDCAQASSTSPDWDPSDNDACATVYLLGANLRLAKTNSLVTLRLKTGVVTRIRYVLTLVNDGPQAAQNVVLSDTLPGEVQFAGGLLPKTCAYDSAQKKIACSIFTLPKGRQVRLQFDATPSLGAAFVTNCSSVTSDTLDLESSSNSACSKQYLTGVDLQITKSGMQILGNQIGFTLSFTNNGPAAATGIVVSDTLPSGLRFVNGGFVTWGSKVTPPGKCAFLAETGTFACQVNSLGPGKNLKVRVQASITAPAGSVANCAKVSSDSVDNDLTNNESCVWVQVRSGKVTPMTPGAKSRSAQPALPSPADLSWDGIAAFFEPLRMTFTLSQF